MDEDGLSACSVWQPGNLSKQVLCLLPFWLGLGQQRPRWPWCDTVWPTGRSLDIVSQQRKLFFFFNVAIGCWLLSHFQKVVFKRSTSWESCVQAVFLKAVLVAYWCFQPEKFSFLKPCFDHARGERAWRLNSTCWRGAHSLFTFILFVHCVPSARLFFTLCRKRKELPLKKSTNPPLIP